MTGIPQWFTWGRLTAFCGGLAAVWVVFWGIVGPAIDKHIQAVAEESVEQRIKQVEDSIQKTVKQSEKNGAAIQRILQEQERAKVERATTNGLAREQRDLSRQILFQLRKP